MHNFHRACGVSEWGVGMGVVAGFLTFQDDDYLQVLIGQRLGGQLVQRTPSLYGVADDQRRNQEDAVAPQRVLHLDVQLTHRDHLTLCRHRPPDHLEAKCRLTTKQAFGVFNQFSSSAHTQSSILVSVNVVSHIASSHSASLRLCFKLVMLQPQQVMHREQTPADTDSGTQLKDTSHL